MLAGQSTSSAPYRFGPKLSPVEWQQIRLDSIFKCCKWDIQSDDHCVLASFPLLLDNGQWQLLCTLAEALASETDAAEHELLARPDLHGELNIPQKVRKLLRAASRAPVTAARVMRFDFHLTSDGWKISEVNADVPGGYIEASGISELFAKHYTDCFMPPNPADAYADAIHASVGDDALIAMVYATVYSDDHQVMEFLSRRLALRNLRTALIGPAQLDWVAGSARLCHSHEDESVDAIIRFYPAEWLPDIDRRQQWPSYFRDSTTPISNPATAILVQSKRFPLVWDALRTELKQWRSLLPATRAIQEIDGKEVDGWVLKPIFGRVGEDVYVPEVTTRFDFERIVRLARRHPEEWIAQQRFRAIPLYLEEEEFYPSIGVFTINGHVAGAYGRIARKPLIDNEAQDIPVLLTKEAEHDSGRDLQSVG